MRVTIKDVANDAGVSTATVSHVINNTKNVSGSVAERVRESIARLHYYPNQMGGSLRSKRSYTVGLVIPTIANETFGCLADAIQRILFEQGFNLIVCSTYYDTAVEQRALDTLVMKQVDAIFAIPAGVYCPKLREIAKHHCPIILLDRILQNFETDVVAADNYLGEYMAITHLIRMGHRHIGYVDRMLQQSHSAAQKQGYRDALVKNGIPYHEDYVINATGHYYAAGASAAQTLMHRCPDITAIACYYDLMALGVVRGLLDLGFCVPADVSVIGYDNMLLTEATYPRLTTVETPIKQIAQTACDLLMRRLQENEDKKNNPTIENDHTKEKILLEPRLVTRESVARRLPPASKQAQESVIGAALPDGEEPVANESRQTVRAETQTTKGGE